MSNAIDQRVVEMRFDNKQFESAVSSTMSTLDKLKQKLNLTGASKGLDGLNAAAKNVNMNSLGSAVDAVSVKFSALQVAGVTALANITNSAVNAGKRIVKSLTIDPIKSGFEEYETKMGSIQTILANTEHQGTNLDQVTAALDKLNLYADKTIYNFQQMTKNIGTFTAAGVDLDTSVKSIQGIANLAAVSGSTSQQASTAMYQLSQALASGTVKLMDWNSVVNAGMGGKVFQNALIRTAAVMAKSADDVEGWQKKNIDAHGSFRDSLTQGAWLTTDVLTKTLEQFTMAAEEGSEEWEAFKKSLESQGYTSSQADEILKMANTATDAATKVKTFTQLMDTLKESAQSGWAQTWENIVGDFEEAKEFFTGLSDLFGGIIGDSAERRNNLLEGALGSNWDKLIGKITDAGVETEAFEKSLKKAVGETKFDNLVKEFGSVEKAAKSGKFTSEQLKTALADLGKTGEKALNFGDIAEKVKGNKFLYSMGGLDRVSDEVKRIQTALNELGYDISPDGKFGKATYQAVMAFQKAEGIKIDGIVGEETIAALEKATGKTDELTGDVDDLSKSCEGLVDNLTKPSGRELLLDSVMNVIKAIHRPLAAIGEAFRDVFSISSDQLYNALEGISELTSKFVPKGLLDLTTWSELTGVLNTLGISTSEFTLKLQDVLAGHGIDVEKLTKKYGSLADAFNKGAISIDHIKETLLGFDGITESMLLGGKVADNLRRTFKGLFATLSIFTNLAGGAFKIVFKVFTALLDKFDLGILDFTAMIGDALVGISDFINGIIDSGIDTILEWLIPALAGAAKAVKGWVNALKESEIGQKIMNAIKNWPQTLERIGEAFIACAETVKGWIDEFMNLPMVQDILGRLTRVFQNVYNSVRKFFAGGAEVILDFIEYIKSFDNITLDDLAAIFLHFKNTVLEYFAGGAIKAFETVKDALKDFKTFLSEQLTKASESLNIFKGKIGEFLKFVKEKFNEHVGIAGLLAVGIGVGLMFALKRLGDILELITEPFALLDTLNVGIKKVMNSLSLALKAFALDMAAGALIKVAIAIAILAASLVALSMIDAEGLGKAVAIIIGLSVALLAIAFVMSKIDKISVDVGGGINKAVFSLVAIAASVYILAQALAVMQGLNADKMASDIWSLLALTAMLTTFAGLLGKYVPKLSSGSTMLVALAGAVYILALAMTELTSIPAEKMGDNLLTIGVLILGLTLLATACKGIGIGAAISILAAVVALRLLIGMVDTIAEVDVNVIKDNIWSFVAIFGAFAILMATSHLAGKYAAKAGAGILAMSVALILIIQAIKMFDKIKPDTLTRAGNAIGQIMLVFAGLVAVSYFAGKNAAKAGAMLLMMSGAVLILTLVIFILSKLDPAGLTRAIDTITTLGKVFAMLIVVSAFAKECTGTIVALTIAVAVLVVAIAALSLIDDPAGMWNAVGAVGVLMTIFAGLIVATKFAGTAIGSIIVITVAIGLFAGILWLLQSLPVDTTIANTIALSTLLVVMAGTLKLLSTINHIAAGALISMGIMLLIVAGIAAIFWALDALDVQPSIDTAVALSTLLLAMSGACLILCAVGAFAPLAISGAVTMVEVVLGIGALMVALGALVTLIPDIKVFAEEGIALLETITVGIGKIFSGFIEGFTAGLPNIATELSTFMTNLEPFFTGMDSVDTDLVSKIETLAGAIMVLSGAEFLSALTSWISGGDDTTSQFVTQLGTLGEGLKTFAANTSGISLDTILPVVEAATALAGIKVPGDGLFGGDGIDDFGADIAAFGTNLNTFLSNIPEIDTAVIDTVVTAATKLAGIKVPDDGMFGGDGIDNFGKDIAKFGEKMAEFATAIGEATVDITAVNALVGVANTLATITIPDDGMFGGDGIDNFGKDIKNFGQCLADYSITVSEVSTAAITNANGCISSIISTINSMAGLDTSGISSFKTAVEQLSGIELSGIVNAFSGAAGSMQTAGADLISSIVKGMQSRKGELSREATSIVNALKSTIIAENTAMTTAGSSLITALIKGISSKESAVTKSAKSAASKASSGAKDNYSSMYQAGQYLGDGLVAGINAMQTAAYNAGFALGQAAVQGEKDGQESESPSKATIKAGKWLGEGLVIGINRMGSSVYKAGESMGKDAVGAISDSISSISDAINSDIDVNPTIRPVLDLSDVKAGAKSLSGMLEYNPTLTSNIGAINTMMNRRSQNGANADVVSAIAKLRSDIANMPRESYNINGVTYDDGSNIRGFAEAVVRQARIGGRV